MLSIIFSFSYLKLTFSNFIFDLKSNFFSAFASCFIEFSESKISNTLSAAAFPFLIEYDALLIAFAGVKTP